MTWQQFFNVCVLQKGYIGDRSIGHEALEIAPRTFSYALPDDKKVLVLQLQGSLPYMGHAIVESDTICILPTIVRNTNGYFCACHEINKEKNAR